MSTRPEVEVKILDERVGKQFALPDYATPGSAGMDLVACLDTTLTIGANESVLLNTGIAIYIGNPDLCATLVPRSGLGHKHGIVLGNLIGIIDADYQGPLMISCWNRGRHPYTVQPGDRLAQIVFVPIVRTKLCIVEQFSERNSHRGVGGFGSTGLRSRNPPNP